jgi:Zn-dependent peptidase ImmA (M78 family)
MTDKMCINHEILRWAREFSGVKWETACEKFGENNLIAWEHGDDDPTYDQLTEIGKLYRKPFASFFLSEIPDIESTQSFFTNLPDNFSLFSPEMSAAFDWGRTMQFNLHELQEIIKHSNYLFKTLQSNYSNISDTASALRYLMSIDINKQIKVLNAKKAFEIWRQKFSNIGIYVFKTYLSDDSICGFSIYDNIFPIICVNNQFSFSRQIFTLFHEIYHIIHASSGIDFFDDSESLKLYSDNIEIQCNDFVGAFLVPDNYFYQLIKDSQITGDNIKAWADLFLVSGEIIARKLLNHGLISQQLYNNFAINYDKDNFRTKMRRGFEYKNLLSSKISNLGINFLKVVFDAYYSDNISIFDLCQYTGMTIQEAQQVADLQGWDTITG